MILYNDNIQCKIYQLIFTNIKHTIYKFTTFVILKKNK